MTLGADLQTMCKFMRPTNRILLISLQMQLNRQKDCDFCVKNTIFDALICCWLEDSAKTPAQVDVCYANFAHSIEFNFGLNFCI